uniref:Keratin-associated protein 19-3 n=1 Tax=Pogona vitticeps TaxID=103695 RepID=A0ABM5F480_9SAUR
MPICGPSNAIPSCAATPSVGFGSDNRGFGGALGLGGLGSIGSSYGGTVSAASLGVLQGVHPACIVQNPASEVTIHPPPFQATIPGPILCASPEGVQVGGYSPCAVPGYGQGLGYGGLGYGGLSSGLLGFSGYNHGRDGFFGYGGFNSGLLGSKGLCNRRGSIFG